MICNFFYFFRSRLATRNVASSFARQMGPFFGTAAAVRLTPRPRPLFAQHMSYVVAGPRNKTLLDKV